MCHIIKKFVLLKYYVCSFLWRGKRRLRYLKKIEDIKRGEFDKKYQYHCKDGDFQNISQYVNVGKNQLDEIFFAASIYYSYEDCYSREYIILDIRCGSWNLEKVRSVIKLLKGYLLYVHCDVSDFSFYDEYLKSENCVICSGYSYSRFIKHVNLSKLYITCDCQMFDVALRLYGRCLNISLLEKGRACVAYSGKIKKLNFTGGILT